MLDVTSVKKAANGLTSRNAEGKDKFWAQFGVVLFFFKSVFI